MLITAPATKLITGCVRDRYFDLPDKWRMNAYRHGCQRVGVFFFSWNGFFGHETIGTGKIVFYFFLFDFLCVVNLFFLTQNVDHRLSKSIQSGRMHFTRWRTRIAFFFFVPSNFSSVIQDIQLKWKKKLRYHRYGYGHLWTWKTDVLSSGDYK